MATLLFSAAGAALGSGLGGTVLGLSGAVIGRAVGATLGRAIDQRILGPGSDAVEVGRLDRLRLTGASEGAAIPCLWGRSRIGGQVIWATRFVESINRRRSGKGGTPTTTEYAYSISLAIGLCKGRILRVGRIWADGMEIAPKSLNLRVYTGSEDQLPDAKIEAVEGTGQAPAFRGLAYVVIEDLDLSRFGNRVPQFTFEVMRPAQSALAGEQSRYDQIIRAAALVPGTGEYALATSPVTITLGPGRSRTLNVNTTSEKTDFETSLEQLSEELPACGAVSLVVSWFGNDLRCGSCTVKPKVEQAAIDPPSMPWRAGGIGRAMAEEIRRVDGRPIYGGTPSDASVIEAIAAIRAQGREVMFYPFILMDQGEGNLLPNPWTGDVGQPVLPWRGRITTSLAPGLPGTPDRTAAAAAEVQAFFGAAQPTDFSSAGNILTYSGTGDWGFRRFILHYAHLCSLAGGVDAFCIGSELRGITQIRGAADAFPAVQQLRTLAAEVKAILGPNCKVSYAADWTEYGSYHADGNLYFPLDELWADPSIDFVGIDNYMPISDWRSGEVNADKDQRSIYALAYLKANIAGGEGHDWFYDSPEGEAAQVRRPIRDLAHDEDWVFRVKDIRNWWSLPHHQRSDGIRATAPTEWLPQSKPVWFTEYGCAAIDKGTNQPNRFVDGISSESGLPRGSSGARDDLVQLQYYRAYAEFWSDAKNNPNSAVTGMPMVDMSHAFAWAWDARPFPDFPGRLDLWSDGVNYSRGHWLNGKATAQPLPDVIAELCLGSGVAEIETQDAFGTVKGFVLDRPQTARSALQPILTAFAVDPAEYEGKIHFKSRLLGSDHLVLPEECVVPEDASSSPELTLAPNQETPAQLQIGFTEEAGAYDTRVVRAHVPFSENPSVAYNELALVLAEGEANAVAVRWASEVEISRSGARFTLPPSRAKVRPGDRVSVEGWQYRIDSIETGLARACEATRIETEIYETLSLDETTRQISGFVPPSKVFPVFMDLPLLTGAEVPHQPHVAVSAEPWPGTVAVWSAADGATFTVNKLMSIPSILGVTESSLAPSRSGLWDEGEPLWVRLTAGELTSESGISVLNGANLAAIGDGTPENWELFQFRDAQVVSDGLHDLSGRIRGLAGTEDAGAAGWPAGSLVILIDRSVVQVDLPSAFVGLAQTYKIGPAGRGFDDPSVLTETIAFGGIGERPYSIGHLTATGGSSEDVHLHWIRRTRIGGDSWQQTEVPLGEVAEMYEVQILVGPSIVARYDTATPDFIYTSAMQGADGVAGTFEVRVAMVSQRFGAGPFRSIQIG